jgi:hypothetical protein
MSVCPSAWNNSAPTGRIFKKFLYLCTLHTSVDKIQVPLKSDKNNGYITWRPIPCVYKQMLRWLLCFQVATTCFSCSPPDLKLNVSVNSFICLLHVKWPLPPGDSPFAVNNNNNNNYIFYHTSLSEKVWDKSWREYCNRYRGLKSFIKCRKCTFRRRVRLFKISKLVYDGMEIVRSV